MPKIRVLDRDIANKIAAGEVVERPGSVVKELVENAVDAGAEHITVEIKNGGITYIRVTDDGCGMNRDDARNCFLRHATSKIKDIADLYAIETLGFRGEALAAISAVSRIELITSDGESGTRLLLEGGEEKQCEETGAPHGTTIIVQDLFFNTPARMKFLKTDRSEGGFIAALMDRLAISNPKIAFKLIQDGKATLSTDGSGKLLDVIYSVMGRDVTKGMLQVDTTLQQVRVYGYTAVPTVTKNNRNSQLCYINGRLVRSQTVFAAIDQAYRNNLFHGRHAVCVIKLTLPYGLVDVNVHPSKMEVKFSNEKLIFEAVYFALKTALNQQTIKMVGGAEKPQEPKKTERPSLTVAPDTALPKAEHAPAPSGVVTVMEKSVPLMPSKITAEPTRSEIEAPVPRAPRERMPMNVGVLREKPRIEEDDSPFISLPPKQSVAPQNIMMEQVINRAPEKVSVPEKEIPYRYVGEAFKSYVLVESGDSLYLIDKHAAHERMIFERLLNENAGKPRDRQQLLVPEQITLMPDEMTFAMEHQDEFEKIGFEIDAFGERRIALRSRPLCVGYESAAEAFNEILSDWMRGGEAEWTERENRALKTVACKAAIKAGDLNDSAELKALVSKLIRDDEIHQCPHGRPVMIAYDKKTIEKAFKRI